MKTKIKEITEDWILFTNGCKIEFAHDQECCEYNYADFKEIDELAKDVSFIEPILFEKSEYGFRFGDVNNMFFVPCYSDQNGYYSSDVEIYYNDNKIFTIYA